MTAYPPAAPTYADPNLTASRFLQNPKWIARRMQELGDLRYIGTRLLRGRQDTVGGAVGYEQVEAIFADTNPEIVAPGSEYTLTTIQDGPAGMARVAKWGKDTLITDESVKRRKMDPVEKGLRKLVNSAAYVIDTSVLSVIASAITATAPAAALWTSAAPKILLDVMKAAATMRGLNLGYEPDTLVVDDIAWAYLAADPTIAAAMRRESETNPVYSGRFQILAGLEVVPVPAANLPGNVGTNAWVIDSQQLGFIATEDLEGGYDSAGELVESKRIREDGTDSTRIRARANFAPVVTDPGAGFKISGIA